MLCYTAEKKKTNLMWEGMKAENLGHKESGHSELIGAESPG